MNNQEELIETEYNRAVNLWNETYSECKLVDLKGKPLSVEPMFDICLDIFASKCKKVLDFGCGTGDIIFQCYEFGNTGYGLGVDVSPHQIKCCPLFRTFLICIITL